jgi:hypothetical protein
LKYRGGVAFFHSWLVHTPLLPSNAILPPFPRRCRFVST